MAKSAMIRARIEPRLKAQAERVLDRLGITPQLRTCKEIATGRRSRPTALQNSTETARFFKWRDAGPGVRRFLHMFSNAIPGVCFRQEERGRNAVCGEASWPFAAALSHLVNLEQAALAARRKAQG